MKYKEIINNWAEKNNLVILDATNSPPCFSVTVALEKKVNLIISRDYDLFFHVSLLRFNRVFPKGREYPIGVGSELFFPSEENVVHDLIHALTFVSFKFDLKPPVESGFIKITDSEGKVV